MCAVGGVYYICALIIIPTVRLDGTCIYYVERFKGKIATTQCVRARTKISRFQQSNDLRDKQTCREKLWRAVTHNLRPSSPPYPYPFRVMSFCRQSRTSSRGRPVPTCGVLWRRRSFFHFSTSFISHSRRSRVSRHVTACIRQSVRALQSKTKQDG